jgi:hypothetical protein
MIKIIMTLSTFCIMSSGYLSASMLSERLYIDQQEFTFDHDCFHIHIGENVWLETDTVHRDSSGLYTLESNILRSQSGVNMEYERKWKCPYCNKYWPIGQACGDKDCPSKYKFR